MCVFSALRERHADEITLVSAEQSRTSQDNEERYAARHAIDLDLGTCSRSVAGSDGVTWLKVTLDQVHC